MKTPFFTIIVVSLNPGEGLEKTMESIKRQTFTGYEILVKDGFSTDGSMEALREREEELLKSASLPFLTLLQKKDKSIYDAMNQACRQAAGEYFVFLNCGDSFYDENVLKNVEAAIRKAEGSSKLFYGSTYCEKTKAVAAAPPEITGFTCYRNIPCHQACFYHRSLFQERGYYCDYRIRADYEHFLWCYYKAKANPRFVDMITASYEGGGYSESRENKKRDKQEHRLITGEYMSRGELFSYRLMMAFTLAPLRRILAENRFAAGIYGRIKERLYNRK